MAEPRPVLEMTGIVKEFPGVRALSGVDFRLFPGEIHALMGENGAGKSTLIKVLTGVYSLDGGTITLDGQDTASMDEAELRRGIGYVIQHAGLFPHRTVLDNVGTVPRLLGWDKKRIRDRSRELLDRVGLAPELADR